MSESQQEPGDQPTDGHSADPFPLLPDIPRVAPPGVAQADYDDYLRQLQDYRARYAEYEREYAEWAAQNNAATSEAPGRVDGETTPRPASTPIPADPIVADFGQSATESSGEATYDDGSLSPETGFFSAATESAATADQAGAGHLTEPVDASAFRGEWPDATGAAPAAAPATSSNGGGRNTAIAAGVIAGVVAGILAGGGTYVVASELGSQSGGSIIGQLNPGSPDVLSDRAANSVAGIAERLLPSVVSVASRADGSQSTGSGFIISADGYILTNNHVISNAVDGGQVTITFADDEQVGARIVGRSTSYDVAVLKVDATALPAAQLGNSDAVVVGDAAVAIGSPLGLDGTVTSGIISAMNRPVTAGGQGETAFISAIQTDAAINPGNSGGPLVNAEGQVIGINSAIASMRSLTGTAGSIGLGFAIPINNAKRIADEIIATGTSTVPIIGVTVDPEFTGQGARVAEVEANTPAAGAGVREGDVIVGVNGNRIQNAAELLALLRGYAPGDAITLQVQRGRGDSVQDIELTLGSREG